MSKTQLVFHRRSREAWLVTLKADDFLKMIAGGKPC